MAATKRFLNDVVKPWEVLNALLAENYAIHNEVSDLARDAKQLAIAIKHQAEAFGSSVSEMTAESRDYSVMSDVADAAKHRNLRVAGRNNKLVLSALHEFKEPRQFRFIRNAIIIQHATHGELDFMEVALEAASYCIAKFGLNSRWAGKVKEAPAVFQDKVRLRFHPGLGVGMDNFNVRFVARSPTGELVTTIPPNGWGFEITDLTPLVAKRPQ